MKAQTVSARLNPDTAKKLELLVKATARSRSYLVAEAIETYVEDQTWQIEAIKEGIEEADKGKFATDKEVKKTFKKWGLNEG
jgi:predicted transcriptional regulator